VNDHLPAATATHFGGRSSAIAPFRSSVELLRANLACWKKHRGMLGFGIFFFVRLSLHNQIAGSGGENGFR
jgi:hypothetical protein